MHIYACRENDGEEGEECPTEEEQRAFYAYKRKIYKSYKNRFNI